VKIHPNHSGMINFFYFSYLSPFPDSGNLVLLKSAFTYF
jgi:hypothetical protein